MGLGPTGEASGHGEWLSAGQYQCYVTESSFGRPGPAALWVFLNEDPDSINDAALAFEMPRGRSTMWIEMPGKTPRKCRPVWVCR
jgi:hypothetical protein